MRSPARFALCSVLFLVGCPLFDLGKDDDDVDGTSKEAAANALTNSASFEGGELIEGLMPGTTLPDVTLLGDDATVKPGQATLLDFSAENPDQGDDPVTAALMQFAGTDDHFEVLIDEPAVEGTTVSFSVELKLGGDVCETLCNQVFDVKLEHALKTESGGVGEHGDLTLTLDCTKKGNPDLCQSDDSEGGDGNGGAAMSGGQNMGSGDGGLPSAGAASLEPGGGGDLQFRAFELTDQILGTLCKTCGATQCTMAPANPAYRACMQDLASRYPDELSDQVNCLNSYYEKQLECVMAAECAKAMECDFLQHPDGNPPGVDACLLAPASLQPEFEKCEALKANGGGAAGSTGGVDAGMAMADGGTTTPDPCDEITCGIGAGGTCGCGTTCAGISLELDCVEGTCECLMDGKVIGTVEAVDCADDLTTGAWMECGFPPSR